MNIDWSQAESMQVYADWLEEQLDNHCEDWRVGLSICRGSGFGIGRGRGIGRGIGIDRGRGIGSSFNIGRGRGIGIGSGINNTNTGVKMVTGKHYLVHCVDWVTIVGRCVEQVGPLTYRFERASKIDTNNGDNWHDLARGDERARRGATYVHMQTDVFVPLGIMAQEWIGDLPHNANATDNT